MKTLTTLSGARLSRLCFGTMQFGGSADEATSRAMYDASRAAGINAFDTAHVYTGGASETLLGRFAGPERDKVYIATKAGYSGASTRANILSTFAESRRRLGLDSVDALYLHRWCPVTPLEETIETLAELQQQGLTRHLAVSNFAAWQVMKTQAVAARFGTRIDIIQPMYNLVKRQAEVELFPMCVSEGIVAMPYSPLGGGLLTGKYARGETGRLTADDRYATRYGPGWMGDCARDLAALAAELGTDPATLAVAWAMRHAVGPIPIVSARSTAQLAPSLAALAFDMDAALYDRITALSRTPPPAHDRLDEP